MQQTRVTPAPVYGRTAAHVRSVVRHRLSLERGQGGCEYTVIHKILSNTTHSFHMIIAFTLFAPEHHWHETITRCPLEAVIQTQYYIHTVCTFF